MAAVSENFSLNIYILFFKGVCNIGQGLRSENSGGGDEVSAHASVQHWHSREPLSVTEHSAKVKLKSLMSM